MTTMIAPSNLRDSTKSILCAATSRHRLPAAAQRRIVDERSEEVVVNKLLNYYGRICGPFEPVLPSSLSQRDLSQGSAR